MSEKYHPQFDLKNSSRTDQMLLKLSIFVPLTTQFFSKKYIGIRSNSGWQMVKIVKIVSDRARLSGETVTCETWAIFSEMRRYSIFGYQKFNLHINWHKLSCHWSWNWKIALISARMRILLVLTTLFGVTLAGVFQVELTKIKSRRFKMMADGTWAAYLKQKVGST